MLGRPLRQRATVCGSPQTERRANADDLAEDRRAGKRSDRVAVAMPAEQHSEVDAAVALPRVVPLQSSYAGCAFAKAKEESPTALGQCRIAEQEVVSLSWSITPLVCSKLLVTDSTIVFANRIVSWLVLGRSNGERSR